MANAIALIIFTGSFAGLFVILWKKIPLLLAFPKEFATPVRQVFTEKIKKYFRDTQFGKMLSSKELFLLTLLSKIRIIFLRLEGKTNDSLINLRKKSQLKTDQFTKEYWDKLKKK